MSWSALRLQLALAPTCFGLYSSQEGLWIFYRFCYFWGILNKVLNGEAPPQDPISYPFIYHFLQKRYPFWMTFIEKLYSFHISNLERCFPFNSCKCAIFKIWKKKKNHKNRKLSRLFHSHYLLLALLSLFTNGNDRFPLSIFILQLHNITSEASNRYVYPLLGKASPYRPF